jgi:hypothetical protein
MVNHQWVKQFSLTEDDLDYITNLIIEHEKPMVTSEIALLIIEKRQQDMESNQQDRFANAKVYNPAHTYAIGDRLIFTEFDNAVATVTALRDGDNDSLGAFKVIAVDFDDENYQASKPREFACELEGHALSEKNPEAQLVPEGELEPKDILRQSHSTIMPALIEGLQNADSLVRVGGSWFVRELLLEIDIGSLHLAEAVLDMNGGGPLSSEEVLEQIGDLGNEAPIALQSFSLDLALNEDERFDEVGTTGKISWFLKRMEPEHVHSLPAVLKYQDVDYDEDDLSDEMIDLETELDDELSPIDFEGSLRKATTTLIYPHRRAGTLPLNAKLRAIFPKAKTPRICVEFVDTSDGSTFLGWVVHQYRYVFGLWDYYTKHQLPVGALLSVERGEHAGQILLSYDGHKARTEWVRVVTPSTERVSFENRKRSIGAEYDDLMIMGVDDLEKADKIAESMRQRPLPNLLKQIVGELSKLTPQGTAHATTIYSSVNIFRRCPPAPIFATLETHPDFTYEGDHYWRISD